MIGLDTNVLARFLLNDNELEAERAARLINGLSSSKTLFISSYAILELVWVLRTQKRNRQDISGAVRSLLEVGGVVIGEREVVAKALHFYENGNNDFGDYFILSQGIFCNVLSLATFDQKLIREQDTCFAPK
jgi:predicted nucleic-acid-binding protein